MISEVCKNVRVLHHPPSLALVISFQPGLFANDKTIQKLHMTQSLIDVGGWYAKVCDHILLWIGFPRIFEYARKALSPRLTKEYAVIAKLLENKRNACLPGLILA